MLNFRSVNSRFGNLRRIPLLGGIPSMSKVGTPLPQIVESGCIYLDYNGTTPVFPEVVAAMIPFLSEHGNPSSGHLYGRRTKAAVDRARQKVSSLVNCTPDELFFTSCGTESDNWAIVGTVMAARKAHPDIDLPHVVTSQVEHPAVLSCLKNLEEQGLASFTTVPVDAFGLVDPKLVVLALQKNTVLVTIMHSNNEVGAIQPIAEISAALAQHQAQTKQSAGHIWMHTDAAQSLGKVKVDVKGLGVDMATIVGHKFGAPKGCGALYVRQGVSLDNYFYGGGQEWGKRAGTENVLLLVGFGRAAELALEESQVLTEHMIQLRDSLQDQLVSALPKGKVMVNGPPDNVRRLPNTLSISINGLSSSKLLSTLSDQMAASAGAACHSQGGPLISSVLTAMRVPSECALGTLRLSVGRHTTQEEVDRAVVLILEEAKKQGVL